MIANLFRRRHVALQKSELKVRAEILDAKAAKSAKAAKENSLIFFLAIFAVLATLALTKT
jgi:hypothetical protein